MLKASQLNFMSFLETSVYGMNIGQTGEGAMSLTDAKVSSAMLLAFFVFKQKMPPEMGSIFVFRGERGIRTLGTVASTTV